jgi:hypothetical protein
MSEHHIPEGTKMVERQDLGNPKWRSSANNNTNAMTYATIYAPHQQRVIDEKNELDDKATKLSAFIAENPLFEKLDAAEQERMKVQNDLMWQYSEVLGQRIAAFNVQAQPTPVTTNTTAQNEH